MDSGHLHPASTPIPGCRNRGQQGRSPLPPFERLLPAHCLLFQEPLRADPLPIFSCWPPNTPPPQCRLAGVCVSGPPQRSIYSITVDLNCIPFSPSPLASGALRCHSAKPAGSKRGTPLPATAGQQSTGLFQSGGTVHRGPLGAAQALVPQQPSGDTATPHFPVSLERSAPSLRGTAEGTQGSSWSSGHSPGPPLRELGRSAADCRAQAFWGLGMGRALGDQDSSGPQSPCEGSSMGLGTHGRELPHTLSSLTWPDLRLQGVQV